MMNRIMCALVICCAATLCAADFRLDRIYGDHAVLQRDKAVRVRGSGATPGASVRVSVGMACAYTFANSDGTFATVLPAQKAGGPYRLEAEDRTAGTKAVSEDVYVGEVWVASGQSNMQFLMSQGRPGFRKGGNRLVRMLTVARNASSVPMHCVGADWKLATDDQVGAFSAVATFFADELQQKLGCAVGILNSSWGGTRVEAWTSREALLTHPNAAAWMRDYERNLADGDIYEKLKAIKDHNYKPEDRAPLDQGILSSAMRWADPEEPDPDEWRATELPTSFEATYRRQFNGAVWFRRTIELPAAFVGKDLVLHLGQIDKHDRTFFNGKSVGATGKERETEWWDKLRVYPVPAALVKDAKAAIAVRVWSHIHAGQMSGPENELYLALASDPSQRIPLDGKGWRSRVERDIGFTFRHIAPPLHPGNSNSPHTLFDGMIEPLLGYSIRGAIWYQGESNQGNSEDYGELMSLMIRDWRARWGEGDFPFIQVELASFMNARKFEETSRWAQVREGQLAATRLLPNSGMASAIDVGDPMDIHPKDKLTVGRRLAAWAFANVYGVGLVGCGPRFLESVVEGDSIRVRFTDCGTGLVAKGSNEGLVAPCMIAGADGEFVPAVGRLEGNDLVISAPGVKAPRRVAYGWAANPLGLNLYNREGFPAAPFKTR